MITDTAQGIWPAAVVVLSDQLYTFSRYNTPDNQNPLCRVIAAKPKNPNLYAYLTQAIKLHGTKVIIRIYPSPGNFTDYAKPGGTHVLQMDQTPAGKDYCGNDQSQKSEKYRDIRDIANEMDAIYRVNIKANGWLTENLYFEPANEPNNEWYTDKGTVVPTTDNKDAWIAMDTYFTNLYDLAKEINPDLLILAPPMGQANYAERFIPGTCSSTAVGGGQMGESGYDFMIGTYGSDKFEGYTWNNYWDEGTETWITTTIETACGSDMRKSLGQHVYQYFPIWIQQQIARSGMPRFITEADLRAPCGSHLYTPLKSKQDFPDRTRVSLNRFIAQEKSADYVIAWLLTQGYSEATDGGDCKTNDEQAWHKAYREDGTARDWFRQWWLSNDN